MLVIFFQTILFTWPGEKKEKIFQRHGRRIETRYTFLFSFCMARWVGQKCSEIAVRGFTTRNNLFFGLCSGNYITSLLILVKISFLGSNIYDQLLPFEYPESRQVVSWIPALIIFCAKKSTKVHFFSNIKINSIQWVFWNKRTVCGHSLFACVWVFSNCPFSLPLWQATSPSMFLWSRYMCVFYKISSFCCQFVLQSYTISLKIYYLY